MLRSIGKISRRKFRFNNYRTASLDSPEIALTVATSACVDSFHEIRGAAIADCTRRGRHHRVNALRRASRWLLAVFFVVAGANHFRSPEIYLGMMPPWLPWPSALHLIAGAAEILGGLALLVPGARRAAGWGLIVLLVVIFPANLHVALAGKMPGTEFSPLTLWLRLPFQAVFIAWVWWVALRREPPAH